VIFVGEENVLKPGQAFRGVGRDLRRLLFAFELGSKIRIMIRKAKAFMWQRDELLVIHYVEGSCLIEIKLRIILFRNNTAATGPGQSRVSRLEPAFLKRRIPGKSG
jgi:hypothetical protein